MQPARSPDTVVDTVPGPLEPALVNQPVDSRLVQPEPVKPEPVQTKMPVSEPVIVPDLIEPKVADPVLLSGLIQGPVGDFQPVSITGPGAGKLGDFGGPGGAGNIPLSPEPEPDYREPAINDPAPASFDIDPELSSFDSSRSRLRWSGYAKLDGRIISLSPRQMLDFVFRSFFYPKKDNF